MKLESRTDEELKNVAIGIHSGTIFCDRQVQDENLLGNVFMPILLGALSEWTEEEAKEIGMIYEDLSEAGPRGINGYPIFMSCKMMNRKDAETVLMMVQKLRSSQDSLLNDALKEVRNANGQENQAVSEATGSNQAGPGGVQSTSTGSNQG